MNTTFKTDKFLLNDLDEDDSPPDVVKEDGEVWDPETESPVTPSVEETEEEEVE